MIDARIICRDNGRPSHVHYGRDSKIDTFLVRIIPIEYVCDCSNCKGDVKMENLDEKEKQYQKIDGESLNLQKLIDADELRTEAI